MKSDKAAVLLLIVIALAVRLYRLSKEVLWLDEARYLTAVFRDNFIQVIGDVYSRQHPPLHIISLHYWTKIFGISQDWLLLFSVVCGVISIVAAYFLVKKLFNDKNLAFVSALFICFSLYHVHYSRDITEQMFLTMMIFLSLLAFVMFLQSDKKNYYWNAALYILSTAGMWYTHHYAFMFILMENAVFFLFFKRHKHLLKKWLIIQLILFLLILPELGYTIFDAKVYGIKTNQLTNVQAWPNEAYSQARQVFASNFNPIPRAFSFINEKIGFDSMPFIMLIIIIFLISGIFSLIFNLRKIAGWIGGKREPGRIINKDYYFGAVFLLLLVAVPLLFTSKFPIIFRIYCFVFTVLFFSTMMAAGINIFQSKPVRVSLIILFVVISSITINYGLKNNYSFYEDFEDWRGAAEFLKQPEQKTDLMVNSVGYTTIPFMYYYEYGSIRDAVKNEDDPYYFRSKGFISIPGELSITPENGRNNSLVLDDMNKTLSGVNDFWLIVSTHISAIRGHQEMFNLIELSFKNVSEQSFGSVRLIKYERR
ncbi:MAG: glycosyltransferase family 39 protein [archaeon]